MPREQADSRITVTESEDVTTETLETVAQQPTQPQDEPEPEDESSTESQPAQDNLAAELKQAIQDPDLSQTGEQTIDPELAAALESYKRVAARKAAENQASHQRPVAPPQGVVIETNRLAEEVPEGFVAKESNLDDVSTDKVLLSQTARNQRVNDSGGFKKPISPDELAGELDEVAVRFEEEINKAAKS
jgi:hypothetical protein